jgi:hypothetical protein
MRASCVVGESLTQTREEFLLSNPLPLIPVSGSVTRLW